MSRWLACVAFTRLDQRYAQLPLRVHDAVIVQPAGVVTASLSNAG